MRLAGFSYRSDFTFLTLSPLSPFCSGLPLYHMAWVGRGGSELVGRNGRLGCRGGHGQMWLHSSAEKFTSPIAVFDKVISSPLLTDGFALHMLVTAIHQLIVLLSGY